MELVGLAYSPWTEKARWALDHHRIAYTFAAYVPMVGEVPLRVRAGKLTGKITVPILFDEDVVKDDSFSIARHAERLGARAPLFSAGSEDVITKWNDVSDRALGVGRAVVVNRMAHDRDAQRESVPKFVPDALRSASIGMAASAIRFLVKKHETESVAVNAAEATIDSVLGSWRDALGGRETLLPSFSYADIAMAVILQMVMPVDNAYIALGPAVRNCWTMPGLARKNADLIEWRDAIYAKHRRSA